MTSCDISRLFVELVASLTEHSRQQQHRADDTNVTFTDWTDKLKSTSCCIQRHADTLSNTFSVFMTSSCFWIIHEKLVLGWCHQSLCDIISFWSLLSSNQMSSWSARSLEETHLLTITSCWEKTAVSVWSLLLSTNSRNVLFTDDSSKAEQVINQNWQSVDRSSDLLSVSPVISMSSQILSVCKSFMFRWFWPLQRFALWDVRWAGLMRTVDCFRISSTSACFRHIADFAYDILAKLVRTASQRWNDGKHGDFMCSCEEGYILLIAPHSWKWCLSHMIYGRRHWLTQSVFILKTTGNTFYRFLQFTFKCFLCSDWTAGWIISWSLLIILECLCIKCQKMLKTAGAQRDVINLLVFPQWLFKTWIYSVYDRRT